MEFAPDPGPGQRPEVSRIVATPNYFRTLGIPLRAGRDFETRDDENAPRVAIVNETFVRRFISSRDPIGQHILVDRKNGAVDSLEIIGVVGDTKQNELAAPTSPEMYQPFAQSPSGHLWLFFRTATENLSGTHAAVRGVFHNQDPEVIVSRAYPLPVLSSDTLPR